jgi:WD40 repeat protein
MGAGESKQDSSSSYGVNEGSRSELELPQEIHQGPIHSLAVLDRQHLLSAGADKDVVLYSWTNHTLRGRYKGPTKDISQVVYIASPQLIIAGSRDRNIYTWKCGLRDDVVPNGTPPPSSAVQCQTVEEPDKTIEGHTLGVTALAVNDDHPDILCSGSRDNSICLWDLNMGRPISSMHIPRNLVTELKWIQGERAVVQSSEDKTLRIWDLRSCCVAQQLKPKQHVQTCCGVSADGKFLLAGSSGSQGQGAELTIWDRRKERKPLREYKGHSESVQSCMFCSHYDNSEEDL